MSAFASSLITLFFGVGLLIVAWRGYQAGELPAGPSGWRAYRPNRVDNPFAFHLFFLLYCASGVALTVWGVLVLFGAAQPMPLR